MNANHDGIPSEILVAYGLEIQTSVRAASGLINQTWIVTTVLGERFVVQRVNPVFSSDVNDRIEFVTQHLAEHNICTPTLVRTRGGEHHVNCGGVFWRVLTHIAGTSYDIVPDLHHAAEAGGVLARFHGAFIQADDFGGLPASTVHDIRRHLEGLRMAVADHAGHAMYALVAAMAHEIFDLARALPRILPSAPRLTHGDPKISNILFDDHGDGVCLVDLDTVGTMALVWELGDAFRSWCNPRGEDTVSTEFSLDLFSAALGGYAANAQRFIKPSEIDAIVPAIQTIYIELAARFCADALCEAYFAWDPSRFSTRPEHNLIRARGQLNAASDLASKQTDARRIVERTFAPAR